MTPELGADEIKISAERAESETFRIVRLHRIVGYIGALSDVIGHDVLPRIAGLHDHKGVLTVKWRQQPSDAEKRLVTKAWESSIGDGANNVTHEIFHS
jgi:hypothetical protein